MEPAQVVGKLCHKHSSESVHLGKYSVHGDKVKLKIINNNVILLVCIIGLSPGPFPFPAFPMSHTAVFEKLGMN